MPDRPFRLAHVFVGRPKNGKANATLSDASVTKQLARLEKVEKENEDYKLIIKDMEKRLKTLEKGDK